MTMRVQHPRAGDGPGVPPATVDVNGEAVPVDEDGTFEVDDEAWLQRFAASHGVDPEDLRAEGEDGAAAEPETDATVGEVIDGGNCPWCDDYEGSNVAQHASSAHPDKWSSYTEDED